MGIYHEEDLSVPGNGPCIVLNPIPDIQEDKPVLVLKDLIGALATLGRRRGEIDIRDCHVPGSIHIESCHTRPELRVVRRIAQRGRYELTRPRALTKRRSW